MLVDEAKQSTWGMRVSSIPPENGHPPAARVDFKAATANPSFLRTQNDVLSEAQNLHTVVNQQFEAVFSNEAKASFEPIKQ